MTAVRLLIESRSAAIAPGEALARAWNDGSGDLYRSMTETHHFVGGMSWYRTLLFEGWTGDAFTETTDFDPEVDYGTPEDPEITYSFSDPITQTDLENFVTDYSKEWGDWEILHDISTRDSDAAHGMYDDAPRTSSETQYVITRSIETDPEATEGFFQAVVFFYQVRLTVLTDVPCKLRLTNGDDSPTTETLEPGVDLVKDVKLEPGVLHSLAIDQIQWSPWSAA